MSAAPLRQPVRTEPTRATPARPMRGEPTRHLRAVATPEHRRSIGPFAVLCVSIVLAALATVLLLNTEMARGSYEAVVMRRDINDLHQQRASLLTTLEAASAPEGLADSATALGMVPAQRLGFVFLEGGSVLEASGY